jgi:hypothetical protein
MPGRSKQRAKERVAARTVHRPTSASDEERPHVASATAVAAEVLRTGVTPNHPPRHMRQISREDETMCVGDPDDSGLANEYSGENTPGGSTPTPDQNDVDEIGRVYGLQEEDSGALRSSAEVLSRRDRHRSELRAPRRPQP